MKRFEFIFVFLIVWAVSAGCGVTLANGLLDLFFEIDGPGLIGLDNLTLDRSCQHQGPQAIAKGLADNRTIIVPINSEIPFTHGSSVLALPNNELLAVWYAGSRELGDDTAIYISRYNPQTGLWQESQVIANSPTADGNPVLFWPNCRQIALFWVSARNDTWWQNRWYCRFSDDLGHTWSAPQLIRQSPGKMIRNKPIVTRDGNFLVPAYEQAAFRSCFFVMSAQSRQWSFIIQMPLTMMNIQPAVVETSDGTLVAFFRTDKGSNILRSVSTDGGQSWSKLQPTILPNSNSAIDAMYLPQTDEKLLAFNNSLQYRTKLTLAISDDLGVTWRASRQVSHDDRQWYYPSLTQSPDGLIHLTYSIYRRAIGHFICIYQWITEAN